jgi:hypothetical protein
MYLRQWGKARVYDGLMGRGNGELGESGAPPHPLAAHDGQGVKPLDLSRDPDRKARGVETGEGPDSAPAGEEITPRLRSRKSYGCDRSNPRDDSARHETSTWNALDCSPSA